MSFRIDYPKQLADNPTDQVQQMQSYLYMLAEQLNYALNTVSGGGADGNGAYGLSGSFSLIQGNNKTEDNDVNSVFNELKGLIIKSADIVEYYKERIIESFNTAYKAISDYGSLTEAEQMEFEKSSEGFKAFFSNIQEIIAEETKSNNINSSGYIKLGFLGNNADGSPIVGIELGQTTKINGEETFNAWSRYTSDRLSFYDSTGNLLAYFSHNLLSAPNVHVVNELRLGALGGYRLSFKDGISLMWG